MHAVDDCEPTPCLSVIGHLYRMDDPLPVHPTILSLVQGWTALTVKYALCGVLPPLRPSFVGISSLTSWATLYIQPPSLLSCLMSCLMSLTGGGHSLFCSLWVPSRLLYLLPRNILDCMDCSTGQLSSLCLSRSTQSLLLQPTLLGRHLPLLAAYECPLQACLLWPITYEPSLEACLLRPMTYGCSFQACLLWPIILFRKPLACIRHI